MTNRNESEIEMRMAEAREVFRNYPHVASHQIQQKVFAQQIAIGMDPYLARLAGGACSMKVIADPIRWPEPTDPLHIINAQSLHPDNSSIWLTFENDTQFPEEGTKVFTVFFVHGRAHSIDKI